MNVSYIVVNTSESEEYYKDYRFPEKFEEVLTKIYDNKEGDIVYQVPLENPSLAQLVDKDEFYNLQKPYNAVDIAPVEKYVKWIDENAKGAKWQWMNNQEAIIKADVDDNDLISAQITYDKGWRAYESLEKLKTKKDVLGNLVIEPRRIGEQEIHLKRVRTWDEWLGYLITLSTLGFLIYYFIRPKKENF